MLIYSLATFEESIYSLACKLITVERKEFSEIYFFSQKV